MTQETNYQYVAARDIKPGMKIAHQLSWAEVTRVVVGTERVALFIEGRGNEIRPVEMFGIQEILTIVGKDGGN